MKTARRVKHFALRLQPSLMEEARKVAKAEGVAVNRLINVAVAEKVSALRNEEFLAERATRGANVFSRWRLPPLGDFTDVLEKHPKSTWFLETYWRRRDDVPAAAAIGCSRRLHISVSDNALSGRWVNGARLLGSTLTRDVAS